MIEEKKKNARCREVLVYVEGREKGAQEIWRVLLGYFQVVERVHGQDPADQSTGKNSVNPRVE